MHCLHTRDDVFYLIYCVVSEIMAQKQELMNAAEFQILQIRLRLNTITARKNRMAGWSM